MTISGEDISRVTNLLKLRPRGMSIAAIAKELHMNRNSVAKYLDLLTASGAVELTRVGPAKLYFTAPRVPVSGMINLSSDFFIMLDENLRVLYVNNHVLSFEDRTRPEVLQKRLDDLSFALVSDEAIGKYLHSTERDEIFQREVTVQKGEETFHFRVKIISTVYENGTQGITILASDITTETEQRRAIQESEENLRAVVTTAPAIILTVNREGRILFANRGAGDYAAGDVIGRLLFDFVTSDQQEILHRHLDRVFTTGLPTTYEVRGYGPAGPGTAWYESHMGPVFQDGKMIAATLISQDVTEVRKAREALRESEARYRAVVEAQQEGVLRFNPDGIFTFCNQAFCGFVGLPSGEIVGSSVTHILVEGELERIQQAYRSLTTGHSTAILEFQARRRDGETRWIQGDFQGIFDGHGIPVEYQAVCRDVTDLKTAEKRIKESEARYRAVVDTQEEGIARFKPDGKFTFANDFFCWFVGKPREEIIGSDVTHILPGLSLAQIRETYRSLTPAQSSTILEFQASRFDGMVRWIQANFQGLFNDLGIPMEYQVVARDVTDLKTAEQRIKESEARYRAVVEDQTEWIVRFRPDGIFTFANDAFCRAIGRGREEMVGKPFTLPLSDEEYARTRKAYRTLTPEHSSTSLEAKVTMPDGTIRFIEVTFRALFDEKGNPREYQAVGRDITDRKKAEELARVEFQSFPVPTYIVRRKGDELICADYNEAAHQETGGKISQLIGKPARDLFRNYPSILANLERCLATKTTIDEEIHYGYTVTGKERDLIVRYAFLPPDGVLVYSIDITERKAAENQLRERVKELQFLYEVSRLIEREGKDPPVLLHSIVRLLPGAFQYPDLAAARIFYQGTECTTNNFASTQWGIREDILVNGVPAGAVEIQYLTRPPVAGEEVFLPDEFAIVRVVAERLGRIGMLINADAALQEQIHLLNEILDRIPMPVYHLDLEGKFRGANRTFVDLTGLSRDQIIGETPAHLWPAEHSPSFPTVNHRILRSGEVSRDERVLKGPWPEPRYMVLHRAPFYGRDGSPRGIVAALQDITDIRKAEETLRASEEQFREMAETSPFPISIIDGEGRYRYVNRKFTELFGYTLDDIPTGRRWFEQAFPDPALRGDVIAAWKEDLDGSRPGMVRPRQYSVRCRNGEACEIIFRPVTLRDGTQYITYEDVTERLHTLDSLRQSESRFRHLFNSMRCCFTLVEPVLDGKGIPVDLTFLEVNSAMERLSGRIREDLLGQQLRELFPKTPPEMIEAIGRVALTGDPKKLAIYHPDLDRTLKVRAYSPWKGQAALIFRVEGSPGT